MACLKEICMAINAHCTIETYTCQITATNVATIFAPCSVIVDAFDDPASKALLLGTYLHTEKFIVGVSGIAGIGQSDSMVTRKIGGNGVIVGDGVSAASDTCKPYAPRVTIAAAKAADAVLQWVLQRNGSADAKD